MCAETKRMVTGEAGNVLDKFYNREITKLDGSSLLTIDKRMFNR